MYLAIEIVLVLFVANCISGQQDQVEQLEELNVDKNFITLSGFSSGGNFAQQLYVSHSSLFSGIAVFSHTYYRCGPPVGDTMAFDRACTKLGNLTDAELYNADYALEEISSYFNQGLIDDPRNLADKPLYVYAGTRSSLFSTDMTLRIIQVFEPYINNTEAIRTRVQAGNLVLPTDNYGGPCGEQATDNFFLANCGFSGAFEGLHFLLGDFIQRSRVKGYRRSNFKMQNLIAIDQTEFFVEGRHDMDTIGYIYIPTDCRSKELQCFLHVYFHGCGVGRTFNETGTNHIVNSGYLEVAEDNNIIMIFPQIISAGQNTDGCWDAYGYTGPYYATKIGAQVTVVRRLLAKALGEDPAIIIIDAQRLRDKLRVSRTVAKSIRQAPQNSLRISSSPFPAFPFSKSFLSNENFFSFSNDGFF